MNSCNKAYRAFLLRSNSVVRVRCRSKPAASNTLTDERIGEDYGIGPLKLPAAGKSSSLLSQTRLAFLPQSMQNPHHPGLLRRLPPGVPFMAVVSPRYPDSSAAQSHARFSASSSYAGITT